MSDHALLAAFTSRLPALDARLRSRELAEIASRVGTADQLLPVALTMLAEGEARMASIEAAFEEVAEASRAGREQEAVRRWLDQAAGGTAPWRERRAVGGRLGIDVIRERTVVAVEAVGIREELLLKLLLGELPANAPPPDILVRLLTSARRWLCRKAAAEVLLAHAQAGGPTDTLWPVVLTRARAPQEHAWVRDACDAWLVAVDPEAAEAHLRAGLLERAWPTEFLLRRLRAERLAAWQPDRAGELLTPVVDDPSEHVGIGAAAALVRVGGGDALALVARLAGSPLPRVRLAALEYLGRDAPRVAPALLLEVLTRRSSAEDQPAVLKALARAARRAAVAYPQAARTLREALDRVVERDVNGESTELAAAARRVCARVADPVAQRLHTALLPRLDEVRPGQRRWWSWSELGLQAAPPEDALGHVLAELSREDHGLWADPDARGLWLQRGDRFRLKGWRMLAEMRRPAPNKRQNFDHSVGRHVSGRVRAPSARMAEVTATTTPGERTVVDRDGSWVPALPSVDDTIGLSAPARLYSAFGVTELRPPASLARRLANRARLLLRYPGLARLRSHAIGADEPSERASYVRTLEQELGVTVRFTLDEPAPRRVRELGGLASVLPWTAQMRETLDGILAPSRTSQPALAIFAGALLGVMLVSAHRRRESIRAARAAIPLVIGGWGTRGKSGTERIKAGLFHGLGHPVFVKTTGCEAMFICARPGLPAKEVFIFRPHDKSSIWEQADMVEQAAGMGARVMLWECMALRPTFVELLEHDWMRDDLVTLTNAFPDHEDIQGPAGHDIATVISSFVPKGSAAVTSEVEFLPTFRERARERGTELDAVDPVESELFGADLLGLFPYQEHPRNIALVARVAERLGLDRMLSIVTMAEHVVPDLGVLRIYPTVRVRGRDIRFINGMSANERTGCVTNWRRTGCDTISVDDEPDHAIVIVVNNRGDRVARSEVFARIMVQDLSADAFVLIGTNLTGLHGYVKTALDAHVSELHVQPAGTTVEQAEARIAQGFRTLRVGLPSTAGMTKRAAVGVASTGAAWTPTAAFTERVDRWLHPTEAGTLTLAAVLADLTLDKDLRAAFDAGITAGAPPAATPPTAAHGGPVEVVAAPTLEAVWTAWQEALARQILHARTRVALRAGALRDDTWRAIYTDLFLRSLRPIEDRLTSGDRIIGAVADAVQPGLRVTCMGVQNIKGTGLDFAYRWVSLGLVTPVLQRARAPLPDGRAAALRGLLAFDGWGLVDSGTVRHTLATPPPEEDAEEAELRERVLAHVSAIHDKRLAALTAQARHAWWMSVVDTFERFIDPIDAIRRFFTARRTMRELRAQTVSLSEAALTMQGLYARQKGGWLLKALLARLG